MQLAMAFLAVVTATENDRAPTSSNLIPYTLNEIRRLFDALTAGVKSDPTTRSSAGQYGANATRQSPENVTIPARTGPADSRRASRRTPHRRSSTRLPLAVVDAGTSSRPVHAPAQTPRHRPGPRGSF